MRAGAVGDVIIDAHGEGVGLLEHHADFLTQSVHIQAGSENVRIQIPHLSSDLHAGNQVVHAVQRFQERGLSAAGRADQSGDVVLWNLDIDIFQCLGATVPEA